MKLFFESNWLPREELWVHFWVYQLEKFVSSFVFYPFYIKSTPKLVSSTLIFALPEDNKSGERELKEFNTSLIIFC